MGRAAFVCLSVKEIIMLTQVAGGHRGRCCRNSRPEGGVRVAGRWGLLDRKGQGRGRTGIRRARRVWRTNGSQV